MDFDKLAYPEILNIAGTEYKAQRNMSKSQVLVPYTEEPDVGIGDIITQKSGKREIHLKVIDVSFLEGGSLGVGTKHPHMLTLKVENTTSQPHVTNHGASNLNIGSISGENVQVGNSNTRVPLTKPGSGWPRQLVAWVAKQQEGYDKNLLHYEYMQRKIFARQNRADFVTFSCYRRRRI